MFTPMFILLHCCFLIFGAFAQGITTYSGPVYVRVGDDFEVRCSTNAFRFPKWSLNGRNLEDDFAIQLIKTKGNGRQEAELRIFDAGPQHSGAYSCDPFDSDKHHVYVVDPDNVNDTQRCFLIKPETSLALGCEPEHKTPFFWYYGKDETRYLPKGHVELRTSQLLFHGVQLSDAGRYICRSVKDPVVETTYHLVTPILTQREQTWTKVALIGSSVALDCDFVADPQPHIEWFIGSDHAELKKRAHHRVHISSNPRTGVPNSRLIVQNVNPSDNNAYTCRASHLMCGIQTEQVVMLRAQRIVAAVVGFSGEQSIRDNIFIDHLKQPSTILAPGDPFSIRCVTPWLNMVNAWKKNDVPLRSGSRFAMTTERLKTQDTKNLFNTLKPSHLSRKMHDDAQFETDSGDDEESFVSRNPTDDTGRSGRNSAAGSDSRAGAATASLEDKLDALAEQKLEMWTLKVDQVELSDAGNYSCGENSSTYFSLKVENRKAERSGVSSGGKNESEILTNVGVTEYGFQGVVVNPKSQRLVLKCNYTGERYWNEDAEPPTYQWYKNQSVINKDSKYNIQNEGSASTLTVSNCDVSDAGNYTCKFNNKQEATLAVYMYPTIENVEGSKIQVQGDPLTLQCKARGAPTPTVTWYKEDAQLETDERIELSEVDGVANAKLVIKDLQYQDKGHYVCKARAANVTRSVEIHVRVKDKYAALWPFLGICAEVAVLCTIIFIYERRRTKPEFEDDDDKKESSSRK